MLFAGTAESRLVVAQQLLGGGKTVCVCACVWWWGRLSPLTPATWGGGGFRERGSHDRALVKWQFEDYSSPRNWAPLQSKRKKLKKIFYVMYTSKSSVCCGGHLEVYVLGYPGPPHPHPTPCGPVWSSWHRSHPREGEGWKMNLNDHPPTTVLVMHGNHRGWARGPLKADGNFTKGGSNPGEG